MAAFLAKAEHSARSCGAVDPGYEDDEPGAWRSLAFFAAREPKCMGALEMHVLLCAAWSARAT